MTPLPRSSENTTSPLESTSAVPTSPAIGSLTTGSLDKEEQSPSIVPVTQKTLPGRVSTMTTVEDIQALNKAPFQGMLAKFLNSAPSNRSIRLAAKRSPHLWVQSLTQLAKLSGYVETTNVDVTIHDVGSISDVDLDARINALLEKRTIDVTPKEVS